MPDATVIGVIGKLPGYGDFVRHGLPARTLEAIDRWLSQGLAADPREWDLGEAVSWRFRAGPDVFGEAPLAGVMSASCDKVGRCFPIIAAGVAEAPDSAWFEAVEASLDMARAEIHDLPSLIAELASIAPATAEEPPLASGASRWWRAGAAPRTFTPAPDVEAFCSMIADWAEERVCQA